MLGPPLMAMTGSIVLALRLQRQARGMDDALAVLNDWIAAALHLAPASRIHHGRNGLVPKPGC